MRARPRHVLPVLINNVELQRGLRQVVLRLASRSERGPLTRYAVTRVAYRLRDRSPTRGGRSGLYCGSPMTLAPGSTLGPYTVTAALGHGGMGVVYTAHDPRRGYDEAAYVADEHGHL